MEISVMLTESPLSIEEHVHIVSSKSCGAVSSFMGTTRDNYKGEKVLSLFYEAYVPMAEKEIRKIVERAGAQWELHSVSVAHRLGTVEAGEPGVVICASSSHRQDSLNAVSFIIDQIKNKVPIWKKEVRENSQEWKPGVKV